MKTLAIIAVAGALASPALAFAQDNSQPVTRAQVRSELIQLESAGYDPALSDDPHYPAGIQAAEAKVAAENGAAATAVGGVPAGTSASGAAAGTYGTMPSPTRIMPGSGGAPCTGPHSFCDLYSGG
jgi:hypothetical protein